jgi:hypothetical protein
VSLFRSRSGDPLHERERDTTIERCDVIITDEPGKKSRFVAKIIFRNGEFDSVCDPVGSHSLPDRHNHPVPVAFRGRSTRACQI